MGERDLRPRRRRPRRAGGHRGPSRRAHPIDRGGVPHLVLPARGATAPRWGRGTCRPRWPRWGRSRPWARAGGRCARRRAPRDDLRRSGSRRSARRRRRAAPPCGVIPSQMRTRRARPVSSRTGDSPNSMSALSSMKSMASRADSAVAGLAALQMAHEGASQLAAVLHLEHPQLQLVGRGRAARAPAVRGPGPGRLSARLKGRTAAMRSRGVSITGMVGGSRSGAGPWARSRGQGLRCARSWFPRSLRTLVASDSHLHLR